MPFLRVKYEAVFVARLPLIALQTTCPIYRVEEYCAPVGTLAPPDTQLLPCHDDTVEANSRGLQCIATRACPASAWYI